eukprot:COSAG02_NODE_7742_length_2866_cov_8.513553_2_plen_117_part_00
MPRIVIDPSRPVGSSVNEATDPPDTVLPNIHYHSLIDAVASLGPLPHRNTRVKVSTAIRENIRMWRRLMHLLITRTQAAAQASEGAREVAFSHPPHPFLTTGIQAHGISALLTLAD